MSITREENGTYTSQVRVKDWTGKTIHKKKRGFKRKKDAKEWERQMLSQGNILNTTLNDFFEIYLEDKKNVIKQRTVYNKRDVFRKHIFPYFADRPMNSFKAPELIQWQNKITSMGYKPTYLNDIHKHFQAVFTHACKVYDLAENPFEKMARMGKPDADEMVFWTIDEYNAFIAQIEPGARYYVLFELLFWTGARIGEALALTKADIDTVNYRLRINKTYYRKHKEDFITPPKTEQSIRTIDIPEFLVKELKEYMDKLYGLQEDDRIFPIVAESVQHKMKRVIENHHLKKIRVHDLRHSHAAYLIDHGVQPLMIKERFGHKDIRVTLNTYGHLYPTKQKELAEMLNAQREEGRKTECSV